MKIIFDLEGIMRTNYKTKQKDKILEIIKKEKKPFTIKDIYKKCSDSYGYIDGSELKQYVKEDGNGKL